MAGIPLSWLVNITSVGVKDSFSLSKLPTLLITKYDSEYINPKFSKFYDVDSVKKAFGTNTSVGKFSNNYFSVVNKMSSKPDLLNVFVWNENSIPAILQGGRVSSINTLKTSGAFSLTIGNDTRDVIVDLRDVVSYTDVATKLQNAINKAGEPTPTTLDVSIGKNTNFKITKGSDGANTQTLTITLDDVDTSDFEVVNTDDSKATFDKQTKTIRGVAQGNTKLKFTCKKEGFNKVEIDVSVTVSASPFNLTCSVAEAFALDNVLNISTNAGDFSAEGIDTNKARFDKATKTITGVAQGSTTLTIKAKFGEASEVSKQVNITIAQTTLAVTAQVAQSRSVKSAVTNPALPNFTKATCVFDTNKQVFRISSGESGVVSISYASAPTMLTDISALLSLTKEKGAVVYNGRNAISSFDDVLSEINTNNGAYFVLAFDWELSEAESQTLGEFVNSSNNRFLGIVNSTNATLTTQEGASDRLKGYNGIILDYFKDLKAVNGFSAGLISAIDFSQTNGNTNLAFNDATRYANQAIQTQAELNTLESNLANSILEFSQIGQSQAWYGMGNIMGTLTNSANVYIGNAYLCFQLQLQFANMFNSQSFIGLRGKNNEGILTSYIEAVFQGCVNNGIIVQGAELTTTEEQSLITAFSDKGKSAVSQCSRSGYFYQIGTADLVNQTLPISIAYVANKAAKRIVITNYVLGA